MDPKGQGEKDWLSYERGEIQNAQPLHLKREEWLMVYDAKDYNRTTDLFNSMQKAQGRMGIKVEDPLWCELTSNHPNAYIDGI